MEYNVDNNNLPEYHGDGNRMFDNELLYFGSLTSSGAYPEEQFPGHQEQNWILPNNMTNNDDNIGKPSNSSIFGDLQDEHDQRAIEEDIIEAPIFLDHILVQNNSNSSTINNSRIVYIGYPPILPLETGNNYSNSEVTTSKSNRTRGRGGPRPGAGAKPKKKIQKEPVSLDPETAVGAACASFARFIYVGEVPVEEKEMFEEIVAIVDKSGLIYKQQLAQRLIAYVKDFSSWIKYLKIKLKGSFEKKIINMLVPMSNIFFWTAYKNTEREAEKELKANRTIEPKEHYMRRKMKAIKVALNTFLQTFDIPAAKKAAYLSSDNDMRIGGFTHSYNGHIYRYYEDTIEVNHVADEIGCAHTEHETLD